MRLKFFALAICGGTCLAATHNAVQELDEVLVEGIEPRYVAPTTRDRIGRIWVPVMLDGRGPYRLVLDTGALRSAVTTTTAAQMGVPLDASPPVMLHGVTGAAVTPTIDVERMEVGDVWIDPEVLPVVEDAFGGAEGLLGIDGMQKHRIVIDFRRDFINIARSKNQLAGAGFGVVRFMESADNLLVVRAEVGRVPVRAIIDTGAQATVGNNALRAALQRQVARSGTPDHVKGATGDVQEGVGLRVRSIRLGELQVNQAHITFADLHIFSRWKLQEEPAIVIGMDVIGLVEQLVIDYRRRELQIKPRSGTS